MRITVVCTGRGLHRRRRLGVLQWTVIDDPVPGRPPGGAHAGAYPNGGDQPGLYVFDCPLCPRRTELRIDRWVDELIQLHDAGTSELDISALPF